MIEFQSKLDYIKKVMLSIERLEQLQTAEDWSYRILNKHKFSGLSGKRKGISKLNTMIEEVTQYLEKKWMIDQEKSRN